MPDDTDGLSPRQHPTTHILLSVVVPAYNEEAVLPEFHRRLTTVLAAMPVEAEVIYVNDGSTDGTVATLQGLREQDARVAMVDLSRNFGKEIALSAGLDHAHGAAVVVIDADLQDPPELIPELVKHWTDGYDVVYAKRLSRQGESVVKRATAYAFYRLMRGVGNVQIPEDTGDYRLLSRRAVEALKQLREQHRFMKGLFAWIGYPQMAIPYQRDRRHAGHTKWNYWRLWNFALEGITSFSVVPLKIATYFGLLIALGAFAYAGYIIYDKLVYDNPVPGYPSLIVIILFLGGVQLITIGIIGEYVGRIFDEVKHRPLYFLKDHQPSRAGTSAAGKEREP
jgi:glycosyltransferase involved in cell wall biosynthesis